MTTSEMLIRAKADFDEVYNAAYEKGKSEGGGADSHYDTFWDTFQQNGNRTEYPYAFYGAWWTDEIFKPKYTIKPVGSAINMFANSGVTQIGNIDFSECMNFTFNNSSITSVSVIDARLITGALQTFTNCRALTSIEKFLTLPTQTFSNTFLNCAMLTEIRFDKDTIGKKISFAQSSLLSTESVDSIIDGLIDLTGQTSQSLSVHGDVFNRMTAEQKSSIANKNWTLSAIA